MTFTKPLLHKALSTTLAASLCTTAFAAIDAPVPVSAYITHAGFDWAWVYPLPAASGLNLTYQSTQGWRIPTAAELANAPDATDFLKADGNVPFNGTDPVSGAKFAVGNTAYTGPGACATPYFSNSYTHCDWQDGKGQRYGPWAGLTGPYRDSADQLVVRDAPVVVTPTKPTPVPLWGPVGYLLVSAGVGLAGMLAARRRNNG